MPPRPVGRPATLPPGTRRRSIRMTDAEYAAVVAFLRQLRVKPARALRRNPGAAS